MRKIDKYKRRRMTAGVILVLLIALITVLCSRFGSADSKTDLNAQAHTEQTVEEKRKIKPKKVRQIKTDDNNVKLYVLDVPTDVYFLNSDGAVSFDVPNMRLSGYFTGVRSKAYEGMAELDYNDTVVFVKEENVKEQACEKIFSCSNICQILADGRGYSGCGASTLYILMRNQKVIGKMNSYEKLLDYADTYGYADQGGLSTPCGGMTCDSLKNLCADVYGKEMINHYDDTVSPSEIIKEQLKKGNKVIALVSTSNGVIMHNGATAHFILVTGVTNDNRFVYANSFYQKNVDAGKTLELVSANDIDQSIMSDFDEPRGILALGL